MGRFNSQLKISGRMLAQAVAPVVVLAAAPVYAAFAYTITDLGTPSGQSNTEGASINSAGNVLINSDNVGPGTHPVLYTGGNGYRSLGSLANRGDTLKQLNNAGFAVGTEINSAGATQAVYEDTSPSSPTPSALSTLSGPTDAYGLNPAGTLATIVGDSVKSNGVITAVTWTGPFTSGGTVTPLTPTNSGWASGIGSSSTARAINAGGTIVGQASATSGNLDAFKTSGTSFIDITPTGGVNSIAEAINTAGQIVGNSTDIDGNQSAFYYDPVSGRSMLLPTLGGTIVSSDAESINTAGDAVGQSDAADDSGEVAVLYTAGGTAVTDLNSEIDPSLGWTLTNAESINDNGSIVGVGFLDGNQEAFLLTPAAAVPEPTCITMMLASTILLRRRR